MRFLFYGAGVLGTIYAAQLARSGHTVTALARGRRLEEIRQHGLVLEEVSTGRRTEVTVPVVDRMDPDARWDWVVVLVRREQLEAVLDDLGGHLHSPNVLVMVNDAAGYGPWIQLLGPGRLVTGFPGAGGVKEGPVVRWDLAPALFQPTTVGEPDGRPTERIPQLRRALRDAGFPTAQSEHMASWQKSHVAWVGPLAEAIYLAEQRGQDLSEDPVAAELAVRGMREAFAGLRSAGIRITPAPLAAMERVPVPVAVASLRGWAGSEHFRTLILAHARAARSELALVTGQLREQVALSSAPTPALDRLAAVWAEPT